MTYAGLMHSTPLSDGEWLDDIIGPARALLARVEAAEALAYERLEDMLFAEQRATDADLRAEAAEAEAARLAARVAELESQLAAQQWRPIDEPAPKGEIEVKMRCAVTDDGGIYKIRTDIFVGWWTSADDSEWRPLCEDACRVSIYPH